MNLSDKQKAPAANQGPETATSNSTSLADPAQRIDLDALVSGVYVAVVQVKGEHVPARYRRRIFLSLAPAQRAMDRATMDGLHAEITLCRLVPAADAHE